MEKISVAVRIRPHSSSSDSSKSTYWKVVDNTISLCSPLGTPISGQNFAFDHVFGTESTTSSIYDLHTKGVISSALHGFNGTVFAYGQTSSGKTFTMRGSKESLGLIGLSVHDVFKHIEKITDREFLVRVSYMEIYNEDINDLLVPDSRKLHVHENLEKGIFVAGLREEIVSSPKQVFELLEFGETHRHVGQTNMNVYSSRSHTIFRMVIESKDKHVEVPGASPVDAVRVSVLNLVDLAGSERVAKTGAGGVRLKEGTHINKSLMTLGNVIKKLSDGAARQGGHIPYRDSKLTRILQPALGGNAKTAIICTIAPEEVHIDETRGTLQFASRAKRVMTCAQVNEILTDAALLKRQLQEIEALRKKLKGLQSEVSEQEILRLRNDLLKYELEKEKLELELQEERKGQLEREQRIREQELKIENLSSLVNTSTFDDTLNKENGKHLENKNIHNDLITVRREKLRSPVNFDLVSDRSAERSVISLKKASDFSELLNFENVADEDLWATMNDGQSLAEPDFLFSTPSRWASSVGSTKGASSSVINVLMSSKVKMDRYRTQLEEAKKEAAELRVQLHEHLNFLAELKLELLNLENEFAESQCVTEGMWDTMKQAKSLLSSVICDFVVPDKPQLKLDLVNDIHMKNSEIDCLTSKVRDLEEELVKFKEENEKLRSQCQVQQSKGDIEPAAEADGNIEREADGEEYGAPHFRNKCMANTSSQDSISPQRHLSNAPPLLMPKYDGAIKVPEVDISAGDLQKDYNICVSNGNDCQRRGSIYGNNTENILIHEHLDSKMELRINEDAIGKVENKAYQASMTEMLLMCKEHICVLERQVLLANLEKDRATAILKEQVDAHEKTMMAMKLEKRRFAEDIKSVMESIAIQDDFCASICHGIEFDKGMDKRCQNLITQLPPLN